MILVVDFTENRVKRGEGGTAYGLAQAKLLLYVNYGAAFI